jgi:hypothetical protein
LLGGQVSAGGYGFWGPRASFWGFIKQDVKYKEFFMKGMEIVKKADDLKNNGYLNKKGRAISDPAFAFEHS